MIKGNLVGLRAVEREDLSQLLEWRNNPEFRKYYREFKELNMIQQQSWFEEVVISDPNTIMFSITRNEDASLLGCCGLVYINWIHRHADLSLYIGWNNSYIDEVGYAEESCKLLLDYGFNELGLNKVWTEIYEFDEKKIALFDKFNFRQDGILRQNYWFDGKWWDSKVLSLIVNEFIITKALI